MATLSGAIGTGSKWLLDKIVGVIAATGINPNLLTFLGLVVNFGAAAFLAVGRFFTGALIIFFAGFLDILDGQVARRQNRVTAFGAFYDSTLDRRTASPPLAHSTIPRWTAMPTWPSTWASWSTIP